LPKILYSYLPFTLEGEIKIIIPLSDDLLRGNEATVNTTVNSALGNHISNGVKQRWQNSMNFIADDLLKKLEE